MKYFRIVVCVVGVYAQSYGKDNVEDAKNLQGSIDIREKFFSSSFAQKYDRSKIDSKGSKNNLEFIDFCVYPPDRSLVYGALQNGRFHGNKINNLPFACTQNISKQTSGAKKFFIKDSNIPNAYRILRSQYAFLSILKQNVPVKNLSEKYQNSENISYIWQIFDTKSNKYIINTKENTGEISKGRSQRLWIIYTSKGMKFTLIFITNRGSVEVIMQYVDI